MKEEKDYIRDITEIRTMMERSSKFLSLSGWAGIMAGIYAMVGAYIAYSAFEFDPAEAADHSGISGALSSDFLKVIFLALLILVLAIGTAIYLSRRKAKARSEKLWNASAKQLLLNMAVPLFTGGVLIIILIEKGMLGLIVPSSLIFYGLALFNAGKFTYDEVRMLGIIQIGLGLMAAYFVEYGLALWALGFGVVHILYGIYIHYKYER
jgi:ABC-type phosphate transport system permease subunit